MRSQRMDRGSRREKVGKLCVKPTSLFLFLITPLPMLVRLRLRCVGAGRTDREREQREKLESKAGSRS